MENQYFYRSDRVAHCVRTFNENFPAEFREIYKPTTAQLPLWDEMLRALGRFAEHRRGGEKATKHPPRGVLLCGPSQVGKTALASMLAHFAAAEACLQPGYLNCELMKIHLRGLPTERSVGREEYIAQADPLSFPVCVIDDLGAEHGNAEARELVNGLIYARSMAPCFTVYTTNGSWEQLKTTLGDERTVMRISRDARVQRLETPTGMAPYRPQEPA